MAHGLETLSPFLDRDFSEIVNMLPGKYKIHLTENGQIITKYALKKVCQERFPSGILNKKKQGFGILLEKWLRQDHGKCLREILLDPRTLNRGYFKKRSMEKLVDVFIKNKGDYFFPNANGIVGLLTLELWHRKYLDWMKDFIVKYVNLFLICLMLCIPLKTRAKVLWALFTLKQKFISGL